MTSSWMKWHSTCNSQSSIRPLILGGQWSTPMEVVHLHDRTNCLIPTAGKKTSPGLVSYTHLTLPNKIVA